MSEFFKPSDKLLALSWKQPFAELMLHGKIETRTWATNYRGWVLICASKTGYKFSQVHNIAGDAQIVRVTETLGRNFDHFLSHYRAGVAIAVGRLVDCRPMRKEDEGRCFVQYHPDLYCHIYEGVTPIDPFPWKGTQGWKEVDIDIKNRIKQTDVRRIIAEAHRAICRRKGQGYSPTIEEMQAEVDRIEKEGGLA